MDIIHKFPCNKVQGCSVVPALPDTDKNFMAQLLTFKDEVQAALFKDPVCTVQ